MPSDGILRVWSITGSKCCASHLFSFPDWYFLSFSFWIFISLFLFFLWIHVKFSQVLSDFFCFLFLYIQYVRMDAKFYHNNFNHDRKKVCLHWRLHCKMWVHQRVFIFKQVILYVSHSWRYPAAWADSSYRLVSCSGSFRLL